MVLQFIYEMFSAASDSSAEPEKARMAIILYILSMEMIHFQCRWSKRKEGGYGYYV